MDGRFELGWRNVKQNGAERCNIVAGEDPLGELNKSLFDVY